MLTELIMGAVLAIIQSLGYAGIFVLMLAESTVLPVPSELVLPFAGYITALGSFDFWLVLIVATLGSIAGATISYGVGKVIGQEALMRVGKYFLLNEHDLDIARKWFTKHGEKTIFICRFIPVVRHVISIPAVTNSRIQSGEYNKYWIVSFSTSCICTLLIFWVEA